MNEALVSQVRRFNRTVTQRVGALDDAYLSRARPLGQARLLWEIGPAAVEVRSLRARLDLDSGYLSRLLRALEADGLIAVEADEADARVRTVRLTEAGRAEWAELDRLSDDLAADILRPLSAGQRGRLAAAMAEVERLLTASTVELTVTDPGHPDAQHCIGAYFTEAASRFDGGFDAARILSADHTDFMLPAGLLLVARLHADPVACGGLVFRAGGVADVKRMWVAPAVRGLGLGRRILAELEARAAVAGIHTTRLETNRALPEAISLYRSAGYHEVPPFNDEPHAHHWFAKPLPPPTT